MIPYRIAEEKQTLLYYAQVLNDSRSIAIIEQDRLTIKDEALHFAQFFWAMVHESNRETHKLRADDEYILEQIIVTLMAYFRSSGHEKEWEMISDQN
ncbi:MAG: hypothetical protein U1F46_02745 [Marinagarivorans sp.]